ncbi:grasp-with-spasm system SPASM domain peptide maturase [Aquimarina sp. AU119]|uniref:grasp-with-spasm system SPASM domain peptide maturase n=1 Tax=Aquimarina sp. AU119 TaxID=2108528 RepID=UPI000D694A43|nr:grasp-with-spasm system SPASM domain peptide maturase [Aquimarina sp. AU119]
MNKKSFKLFANCIIVKGASLATICDLHRGKVYSIPLPLAEFLEETKNNNTLEDIDSFSQEDQETVQEYLEYLKKNELGFWTDEPEKFPDLNLQWKSPEHINNAIIEMEQLDYVDLKKITTALTNLLCKFIEIRFYKTVDLDKLAFFAENCSKSVIRSITIFLPLTYELDIKEVERLSIKYPRIVLFVVHSAKEKNTVPKTDNSKIQVISRVIDDQNHCGVIDPKLFSIKIPVFTESLKFNSCLNKKLSIDKEGNIKNCPSMLQSYGNIKKDDIETVVKSLDFQKKWGINKDLIKTCKDCEYRRVCTDCRAYVDNPEDQYSKPLKCGYNPYMNTWEEWSTNSLKQNAIKYYGFQAFLKR